MMGMITKAKTVLKWTFIYDAYKWYRKYVNKREILKNPKIFIEKEYKRISKRTLNLDNPQTFTEKIQYIKLNKDMSKQTICADKVKVREWIVENFGQEMEQYFPKWYGVYKKYEDIDFDKFPNQFVLKPNHASGYIFICTDKEKLNKKKLKCKIDKWMNENFYYIAAEPQYKNMEPYIICEELLQMNIIDYRIFCFGGKPYIIRVTQHNKQQLGGYDEETYFCDWKETGIVWNVQRGKGNFQRPSKLDEMLELAGKLSKGFSFVRIDLYETNGEVYFSEMTFTPLAGFERSLSYEWDLRLGNMIDLGGGINRKEIRIWFKKSLLYLLLIEYVASIVWLLLRQIYLIKNIFGRERHFLGLALD